MTYVQLKKWSDSSDRFETFTNLEFPINSMKAKYDIRLAYLSLKPSWLTHEAMRIAITDHDTDLEQSLRLESSPRISEDAVLELLSDKVKKLDPNLIQFVPKGVQNASLKIRKNSSIRFSTGFQRLFHVPSVVTNTNPANMKSVILQYQPPKTNLRDSIVYLKCSEIYPNDNVMDRSLDRILAVISTSKCERADEAYEFFGSVDNRTCHLIESNDLSRINVGLYNDGHEPISGTSVDLFIILHIKENTTHHG
jgi:hypothetical protein